MQPYKPMHASRACLRALLCAMGWERRIGDCVCVCVPVCSGHSLMPTMCVLGSRTLTPARGTIFLPPARTPYGGSPTIL